ncbi:hypothetical protein NS115_03525 [Paenibacillus jamilae]|uniref:Uncharacterized protein n=1 Tax=Paenibacillus jamilae TaxID=114136 RepID=A0ACC4ZZK9_9BACL|nr:hypothetical protein [Paenibacillus jamilae]KTS84417.1 hypothetical protein NS115_03525 [Paenibacillus jamilae]
MAAATSILKLPLIDDTMTANVVRDLNALAQDIDSKVMPKSGGTLDASRINVTDGTRTLVLGVDANEPWIGTSTNNDFRIITNGLERGRVKSSGALVWLDRILTSRSGIQVGQDATAWKNFHVVSDDAGTGAAFRIYNGVYGAGARVFSIDQNGHIMLGGQTEVLNAEGWSKVVDIYQPGNLSMSFRTNGVHGAISVHDSGFYGSAAGLMVGTKTNHDLTFIQNSVRKAMFGTDDMFYLRTRAMELRSSGNNDAGLYLIAGNTPANVFGRKEIISSVNIDGGNALLFRARRESDWANKDVRINFNNASGEIYTENHIIKSTGGPSGGFDGQIWIQYV